MPTVRELMAALGTDRAQFIDDALRALLTELRERRQEAPRVAELQEELERAWHHQSEYGDTLHYLEVLQEENAGLTRQLASAQRSLGARFRHVMRTFAHLEA